MVLIKSFAQVQLPNDPGAVLQAGTKQYIDTADATKASATHTHAESDVTSLTTDLSAKAPTASPTFTGTATFAKMVQVPVALTDATTIAVDASLGNTYRVTLAGNRTLGAPSNPTDGQMLLFEIKQDATGSRTLALATGTGAYKLGSDITAVTLSTVASTTDYLGVIYNSTANLWRVIAFSRGY
jgi:hypothetical protein